MKKSLSRKSWTQPVITVIDLNVARSGTTSTVSDNGSDHKS